MAESMEVTIMGFNTINTIETITEKYVTAATIRAEYRIDDKLETSIR